ncbi:MAG: AraC family transcriptional regulator [Acidobacteriota bacterium]
MTRTAEREAPPFDTLLFESGILSIGKFRAFPDHPRFSDSGPIRGHLVVFPRTLVRIAHAGGAPFVAGPDLVTYYNRGQAYRRESVHGMPDRCEWFSFAPGVLREAIRAHDPGAAERRNGPFVFVSGPSDARSYFRQRSVVGALSESRADPWQVEETMLGVLETLLAAVYRDRGKDSRAARTPPAPQRSRTLAQEARTELGRSFRGSGGISDLARALDISPFQLCRIFRRETGTTLHRFRERLRLAAALELLRESRAGLTDIALDLGYSSHSHFSASFRRAFGVTPSAARAGTAAGPYRRT